MWLGRSPVSRTRMAAFALTERHIDEYHTQGYTVFESVVPAPLVHDLRAPARGCDRSAQRTQVRGLPREDPLFRARGAAAPPPPLLALGPLCGVWNGTLLWAPPFPLCIGVFMKLHSLRPSQAEGGAARAG